MSASSSEEKARALPMAAAAGQPPDLVVAVGTASLPYAARSTAPSPSARRAISSILISGAPNREIRWSNAGIGRQFDETDRGSSNGLIGWLAREARPDIETRFLPPLVPAAPPILIASTTSVSANVNVTNPDNYVWADHAALAAFSEVAPKRTVGSVETTHGVIRICIPSPRSCSCPASPSASVTSTPSCRRAPVRRTSRHPTTPK
jgi:hypothetical protein